MKMKLNHLKKNVNWNQLRNALVIHRTEHHASSAKKQLCDIHYLGFSGLKGVGENQSIKLNYTFQTSVIGYMINLHPFNSNSAQFHSNILQLKECYRVPTARGSLNLKLIFAPRG